jgi:predicted RNase H-like HicB family nuclease
MQYQVFVQSRTDGRFSATVVGVPECVAEGTTQEEALTKATAILRARLTRGSGRSACQGGQSVARDSW